MIAAAAPKKRISTGSRGFACLVLCLVVSAPLAFGAVADDQPKPDAPSAKRRAPEMQFTPMTGKERFRNYLGSITNLQAVTAVAAQGGIGQAQNTPKEWGGGAEGFGKRVGDAYARYGIRQTLQYGVSTALHEDNRYFVSGQTGVFRRTAFALKSTLLARRDDGRQSFAFSRMSSAAGAAFISRAWQPRSTTTAGDGAINFGLTMASDAGFNLFREFWPDLIHRFHKR